MCRNEPRSFEPNRFWVNTESILRECGSLTVLSLAQHSITGGCTRTSHVALPRAIEKILKVEAIASVATYVLSNFIRSSRMHGLWDRKCPQSRKSSFIWNGRASPGVA